MAAITACPKPIIGAINGVVRLFRRVRVGAGFWCDVLIASTNARIADTHARIGVAAGLGPVAETAVADDRPLSGCQGAVAERQFLDAPDAPPHGA